MLWGGHSGGLELRKRASGAMALRGRFPYNSRAVLSDGGRTGKPRKEIFAPGAFRHSVETDQEIHLLVGHSFDKPLASRGAGNLTLEDTPDALIFEASISEEMQEVGFVKDTLTMLAAGLVVGISPGFRIPPKQTVPNAEKVEEEDPSEGRALVRTVFEAILSEISLVVRPAYPETQIEARSWAVEGNEARCSVLRNPFKRWRA